MKIPVPIPAETVLKMVTITSMLNKVNYVLHGNDLDAAIEGRGYFMLQDDKGEVYTRSGQFDIAADGYLVARGTERRLLFINDNGTLQPVNINDRQSNAAKATQKIVFSNTLNDTSTTAYSTNATVYDSLGKSHTLVVKFTKFVPADGDTRTWQMEVSENGTALVTQEVRFQSGGTPASGFENISFDYQPSTNVDKVALTLDLTNTTISAATSNIAVSSQDGYSTGSLLKTTFDTDGTVIFSYSNDQKIKGPKLALAYFNFDSGLEAIGENLFINSNDQERTVGKAGEAGFGKIAGGSIEASNVDLADQFSELIIIQRGYQASSQVITTANEMIQQLFDMKGKR